MVGDMRARLTFTVTQEGEPTKRLVYVMYWMPRSAADEGTSKALFFAEEPATAKGFVYMGWFYPDEANDEWLYIPELRTVRRLVGSHAHHHEDEGDDPFDASVLQRLELEHRPSGWGTQRASGSGEIGGEPVEWVDVIPPHRIGNFPYETVRIWSSQHNGLPVRTHYLRSDGTRKEIDISWRMEDGVWVWSQVTGLDTRSGAITMLDVSDVRVNMGLRDRFFSERTMRQGLGRVSR
ncbi:MAG: outer membrane lipoprotein-sorting protein [Leptospirillia bacterium]